MDVQAVVAVSVASTAGVWLGCHESGPSLFEQMVAQTVVVPCASVCPAEVGLFFFIRSLFSYSLALAYPLKPGISLFYSLFSFPLSHSLKSGSSFFSTYSLQSRATRLLSLRSLSSTVSEARRAFSLSPLRCRRCCAALQVEVYFLGHEQHGSPIYLTFK